MNILFIQTAAIVMAVISFGIGIFQIMLALGIPLGEYCWGGKYKGVLPDKLRLMSLLSAFLLFFFGLVFLVHTNVVQMNINLPTTVFVWIITIFLGLNILGNLASKSKKEKIVMTPLAAISFISCLIVVIFS